MMKEKTTNVVPLWIKTVTTLFIIISLVSLSAIPLSFFRPVYLELYGISCFAQGISPEIISIALISVVITIGLMGIVREKKWGPAYTLVTGFCLLVYFLVRFIDSAANGPLELRLEPFLILLFLGKLIPLYRNKK